MCNYKNAPGSLLPWSFFSCAIYYKTRNDERDAKRLRIVSWICNNPVFYWKTRNDEREMRSISANSFLGFATILYFIGKQEMTK